MKEWNPEIWGTELESYHRDEGSALWSVAIQPSTEIYKLRSGRNDSIAWTFEVPYMWESLNPSNFLSQPYWRPLDRWGLRTVGCCRRDGSAKGELDRESDGAKGRWAKWVVRGEWVIGPVPGYVAYKFTCCNRIDHRRKEPFCYSVFFYFFRSSPECTLIMWTRVESERFYASNGMDLHRTWHMVPELAWLVGNSS